MRTDVKVGGNMVLAIVFSDVAKGLTHPVTSIRRAITAEKLGELFIAKAEDWWIQHKCVVRNKNSRRRKCDVIYLNKVDDDLREQLLAG